MPDLKVGEIARLVGGEASGDLEAVIHEVAPLEDARPGALSFVANPRYLAYLHDARPGVLLVPRTLAERIPRETTRIVVEDAHVALYHLLQHFRTYADEEAGIHRTAVVEEGVELGEDVTIGAFSIIGRGSKLGPRCRIGSHVAVGSGCRIGAETVLHAHVTLYHDVRIGDRCILHSGARIGREGFGYVWMEGGHRKVPQVGGCVIEDDVEIGTNVTIDRGSLGDTRVGEGTKIDSLVHLGHNVRVGRHVILVAQVGIAGSSSVGDGAVLGGQVGVAGHLEIGAGARVGAQAGVTADVPAGESYSGYPARPHREALRAQGALFRLPDFLKRVRELERAISGGREDTGASTDHREAGSSPRA